MYTVYLPYALGNVVKVLSYIAVALLDIINFIFTPIKWIQFKAHIAMVALAGVAYAYLSLVAHHERAVWIAVLGLAAAILAVALLKWLRKKLNRIRQALIRVVYSPVGVCINIRLAPFIALYRLFNGTKTQKITTI